VDPSQVKWVAVFVAALSAFMIGGLWYSPVLFYKRWLVASGVNEEKLKSGAGGVFAGAFLCALIGSANLGFFIPAEWTGFNGALAGFGAGFGWVATGLTTTFLFERRPAAHIVIDASYHVVTLTVMGAIIGAWP